MALPLVGLALGGLVPGALRAAGRFLGRRMATRGAMAAGRYRQMGGLRALARSGIRGAVLREGAIAGAVWGGSRLASRRGAVALGAAGAGAFGVSRLMSGGPGPGGLDVPVAYTWDTDTAQFARLANGKIAVQKKDGTIKVYRPYRPVVVPKKWSSRSMGRVATALKRQRATAQEILRLTGGSTARRRSTTSRRRTYDGTKVTQIKA